MPGTKQISCVSLFDSSYASYESLTGSFEIPYSQWQDWAEMLSGRTKTKNVVNTSAEIIGRRAALELKPDDIVNIGVGIPETVSKYARENGILDKITLTVESGGVGGFPASGKVFGAVIGADSIYDMATSLISTTMAVLISVSWAGSRLTGSGM